MRPINRYVLGLASALVMLSGTSSALAQQQGGTLRTYLGGNPPSASLHEESTIGTVFPFMSVFNNLFVFNPSSKRATAQDLTPELATEWHWSDDHTRLTLKLREGVTWHDGKPFTSADVKCTWDTITGKREAGWRKNPRRDWYTNLKEVVTNGDHEVSFQLERPQPSFMDFLASGFSPVYPCHVDARTMRQKPVGTGPFRIVDFQPNQSIKLARNPDYWRKGRPFLDGITFQIVSSRATRQLAFVSGEFDMTAVGDVTAPLMIDVKKQLPDAQCEVNFPNVSGQILMNRAVPPFDDPKVRRAVALSVDRNAFVEILGHGQFAQGGALLPPPAGSWGVTAEDLAKADVPGFAGTLEQRRDEARQILRELGYSQEKPLRFKLISRDIPSYRDASIILIDHLKSVFIEAELQLLETSQWYNTLPRDTWGIAQNLSGIAVDDPDVVFYESYMCGSPRNYPHYCNKDLERRIHEQSATIDPEARRRLVREIDIQLQKELARPALYHMTVGTCRHPHVRGLILAGNTYYTHYRMEDVWLAPR